MKPRNAQPARSRPAGRATVNFVVENVAADNFAVENVPGDEEPTQAPSAVVRSMYDRAMARTARHDPGALQRYLSVLAAAPGA